MSRKILKKKAQPARYCILIDAVNQALHEIWIEAKAERFLSEVKREEARIREEPEWIRRLASKKLNQDRF